MAGNQLLMSSSTREADSSHPTIRVTNLTKRFEMNGAAAVNGVSFEVNKEVVSLFGPSGCGKTTTLRCIAGLERPDSGEIEIDGQVVTSAEKGIFVQPEKRDIGLVFQSYALWPHMKVVDNITYGLKVRHIPKDEIRWRTKKVLESVGLSGYEDRYPAQLSGGQQQRVALARSMVYEPKVLLLDEPLSNLDAKIRERTRVELKSLLNKIGISSVYVTHDQEEAFLMSDKIVVMDQGKIMQQGSPYEVYQTPSNKFVASFVGRSNLVHGTVLKTGQRDGVARILGDYDIVCEIPQTLKEGENCVVMIRANEVGLYDQKPENLSCKKCEIVSADYKGAETDYLVRVSDTSLIVTTHRFCNLNGEQNFPAALGAAYISVPGTSISIVPEGSITT
jgi:iron(III) transport system ATP-binding protein